MEKSGDEDAQAGNRGISKKVGDRRQAVDADPDTACAKFERLERRKQIVPGFVEVEPTGDEPLSTAIPSPAEDCLNPMLRTGSPLKPDQEHKKP